MEQADSLNIPDNVNFEDYVNSNEFYVFDKDDEICEYEATTDAYNKNSIKKCRGKAYRRFVTAKHKRKLVEIIDYHRFYYHMGYIDWDLLDGALQRTGRYIKYPKNSNRQRFLKRYSNKVVRKYNGNLHGNQYRKCFDYWWKLY